MKAVGYRQSLPLTEAESLFDFIAPDPVPSGRDLLVEIRAIAVNPVDGKVRLRAQPPAGQTAILGWDAAGIVKATGPDCTLFKPGDDGPCRSAESPGNRLSTPGPRCCKQF